MVLVVMDVWQHRSASHTLGLGVEDKADYGEKAMNYMS